MLDNQFLDCLYCLLRMMIYYSHVLILFVLFQRVQHTLSSPLQVEKQTSQPNSQSIKTPTANRDRVLSPNRATRPKQSYQPTQIGIT
jgi:hypothetical protein